MTKKKYQKRIGDDSAMTIFAVIAAFARLMAGPSKGSVRK
jgi:hypothetical protein